MLESRNYGVEAMSAPMPTYDEMRLREELDLAAHAANTPAARSHEAMARLYLRRIAENQAPVRPVE